MIPPQPKVWASVTCKTIVTRLEDFGVFFQWRRSYVSSQRHVRRFARPLGPSSFRQHGVSARCRVQR